MVSASSADAQTVSEIAKFFFVLALVDEEPVTRIPDESREDLLQNVASECWER